MSKFSKFLLVIVAVLAGATTAGAQIGSVQNVDTVAYVSTTPATQNFATITGGSWNNTSYIYASGYFSVGDGGAGFFTKIQGTCSFTASGTLSSGQKVVTFSSPISTQLTRGMGIGGTGVPSGDTIDSFKTTATATTIWMSLAATQTGSQTLTIYGGNGVDGGSLVADHAANCWQRTSAFTGNVREYGASCDVQVASKTGTYTAMNGYIYAAAQTLGSNDTGKFIVAPNIGTGLGSPAYYSVLPVVGHGTSLASGGGGYNVGDTVNLKSQAGATATTEVSIKVDAVNSGSNSAITSFHFLSYGQYASPANEDTLIQDTTSGGGTGVQLSPAWLGATYTDAIASVTNSNLHANFYFGTPAIPASRDLTHGLNLWWYGHDDGAAINGEITAVVNSQSSGLTVPPGAIPPGPPQVFLPGKCGTTVQIKAPTNDGAPVLTGTGIGSSGLYALAPIVGSVYSRSSTNVLSHGGGLTNMTVEAGGLTTDENGNPLPAVSVYGGVAQTYSGLYIRDASGNNNAVLRCGQNDFMPTGNLTLNGSQITNVTPAYGASLLVGLPQLAITDVTHPSYLPSGTTVSGASGNTITMSANANNAATGDLFDIVPNTNLDNGWFQDIRAEADGTVFSGPLLPDFDVEVSGGCHDSFFSRDIAVNALFFNAADDVRSDGVHLDNMHTFNTNYPDVGGSAWYGLESLGHDWIDFPQTDDGLYGAIYIGPVVVGSGAATRIYGSYVTCGVHQTAIPAPGAVTTTGNITVGSTAIASVGTTSGYVAGDPINAPQLQPNTYVTSIAGSTVNVSQPALATASGASITVSHGFGGIELYPGSQYVTVAGTAQAGKCNFAANQIVTQDGLPTIPADPSTQILAPSIGSYSTTFSSQANAVAQVVMTSLSSYPMTVTNYHLCVSPPIGGTNVTLPPNPAAGVVYTVDNCTNNAFTIKLTPYTGNGNIDNASSYSFSNSYGSWSGYYTGLNWKTTAIR